MLYSTIASAHVNVYNGTPLYHIPTAQAAKQNTLERYHYMSQKPGKDNDDFEEDDEYSEMELLEMLESVREDMEDLGVTTLQEVIARINELHRKLDAR